MYGYLFWKKMQACTVLFGSVRLFDFDTIMHPVRLLKIPIRLLVFRGNLQSVKLFCQLKSSIKIRKLI